MAETTQDQEIVVAEALGKTEQFISHNRRSLSIITGALLLAVGGYFFYQKVYVANKEKEAQAVLFHAEQYFFADSLRLAINGDGNNPGLEEIADEYSMSPSGNLAKYYLGMAYFKLKDYERAIETLRSYDANDAMTGSIVYGAIGDAYMEKNEKDDAISYYKKAVSEKPNNFSTPIMLMKLATAHEANGNFKEAKAAYERIQKDYPSANEATQIDRYISRTEALAGK
jgi:TolA-binding protein